MSVEEMEVFGVDWEVLCDDSILVSHQENNNINEGSTSWLGRRGPPEHLNEITVDPPTGPFSEAEMEVLDATLLPFAGAVTDEDGAILWLEGLATARRMWSDLF
ncbi:hypothetical protein MVEN_01725300 [Mycena venus]|uniref:Uncharacterized protein n=1 Tax=Mycena venus TaxID=2733690 RepID=A0A8H6XKK9_9AGAR|nr:hypothetical protein MVEN_01725300 [Mycena venus]